MKQDEFDRYLENLAQESKKLFVLDRFMIKPCFRAL